MFRNRVVDEYEPAGFEKFKRLRGAKVNCSWFPTKRRWATHEQAKAALKVIAARSSDDVFPVRAYECECGGWHLTSQTWVELKLPRAENPAAKMIRSVAGAAGRPGGTSA